MMELQIYKIAFDRRDIIVHTIKPKVSALLENAQIVQNIALASIHRFNLYTSKSALL